MMPNYGKSKSAECIFIIKYIFYAKSKKGNVYWQDGQSQQTLWLLMLLRHRSPHLLNWRMKNHPGIRGLECSYLNSVTKVSHLFRPWFLIWKMKRLNLVIFMGPSLLKLSLLIPKLLDIWEIIQKITQASSP